MPAEACSLFFGCFLYVTFLDQGTGTFKVRAAGKILQEKWSGSGRWRTVEFQINPTGDLIAIEADADLTLHMIELSRGI